MKGCQLMDSSAVKESFKLFCEGQPLGPIQELEGLKITGTMTEDVEHDCGTSFEVPVTITVPREEIARAERIRRNREGRRAQAPGWNRSLSGVR